MWFTNMFRGPALAKVDWSYLLRLAAVLVAMTLLVWNFTADSPWGWLFPSPTYIQIQEQVYRVPERHLDRLSQTQPRWVDEAGAEAAERLASGVNRELDSLFVEVHERVPVFVDWYYSVSGVTARVWASFWSGEGDFLADEVMKRVFPEEEWSQELDAFDQQALALYREELGVIETQWLAWLARELAPYRYDGPVPRDETKVDFDARLQTELIDILESDRIGQKVAVGAGVGLLASSAIVRVSARAASLRAATRLAGRAGAGKTATVCGLTGPFVIGCGVVVFVTGILGTEWVILKADEALNRDELEEAMDASVYTLRALMDVEYAIPLKAEFESKLQGLEDGIRTTLRPVDHLRKVPTPG